MRGILRSNRLTVNNYNWTNATDMASFGVTIAQTFGSRLGILLKLRGWTHLELERVSGVKNQSITTYRQGKVAPNAKNIVAIAKAFDCPSDYLLGLRETCSPFRETVIVKNKRNAVKEKNR